MGAQINGKAPLDRTQLCKLAGVSRGKHIRWTKEGLLSAKQEYGELDLIRAAMLDELTVIVKPSVAKTAWRQIEKDLHVIVPGLQVVVATTTKRAHAIHTEIELDRVLPRNEPVVVVALTERVELVRARLREFRANTAEQQAEPQAPRILKLQRNG
jgi:hypothetical protein